MKKAPYIVGIAVAGMLAGVIIYKVLADRKKTPAPDSGTGKQDDTQTPPERNGATPKKAVFNKKAYAKVADVSLRNAAYVNNGLINNEITTFKAGDLIGYVESVKEDTQNTLRPDGQVYEWYHVILAKPYTYWLTGKVYMDGYVREDVVKMV